MRQTLFHIPAEIGGWPVFGFGLLLAVWVIVAAALLIWLARRQGWTGELVSHAMVLGLVGAGIAFLLPRMVGPQGLPVRGFGVMLLLAVAAGMWLALRRARQMRVDPEVILSLALWMIVPGIVGARAFYVIQYWDRQFHNVDAAGSMDWPATLRQMFDVTEGGLVVYGSVLGAALGLVAFVRIHRLNLLALGDVIAPSLALGQAIGRIGCFLNGCCYGGIATLSWALAFPPHSPPYDRQVYEGQIPYGLVLRGADDDAPLVSDVVAGSEAAQAGLQRGDRLAAIDGRSVATLAEARERLLPSQRPGADKEIVIVTAGREEPYRFAALGPPPRSLPIHPTQLYGAIDGLLICLFLLAYTPFRRRDGEVIAWLSTIYPVTRFLMEMIRTDEPGWLGAEGSALARLTSIGQLISLGILVAAAALWLWLRTRPRGSVLASPSQSGAWVWTLAER
jgi:phosphatidylglycerol:prolipoprotein diacylglycerol transferase